MAANHSEYFAGAKTGGTVLFDNSVRMARSLADVDLHVNRRGVAARVFLVLKSRSGLVES
jgi:hypothetical protein